MKLVELGQKLRKDQQGFQAHTVIAALIAVLIAVVFGLALVSTVLSSVASVNATADYAAGSPVPGIVNLIPLLFVLGIAIASVAIVFVALRSGLSGG